MEKNNSGILTGYSLMRVMHAGLGMATKTKTMTERPRLTLGQVVVGAFAAYGAYALWREYKPSVLAWLGNMHERAKKVKNTRIQQKIDSLLDEINRHGGLTPAIKAQLDTLLCEDELNQDQ